MTPSEETCRLYGEALRLAAVGREPDDQLLCDLASACRADALVPAAVIHMHAELSARTPEGVGASPQDLLRTLALLERVVGLLHADVQSVAHDLRNSAQLVSGTLSLLQRDIEHRGGTRTVELTARTRKHATELQRRIEKLALGKSNLTAP